MAESSDSENSLDIAPGKVLIREEDLGMYTMNADFSQYTKDANFCVYMKIVHNKKEAEDDIKEGTFFPDFVHQFFTASERIFGYKGPILRLFYSPSRLRTYIQFNCEDQLTREKHGIDPDDIMQCLSPILETIEYTKDLSQFVKEVESKEELEYRPSGHLIKTFINNYRKPPLLSRAQLEQLEAAGTYSDGNPQVTISDSTGNIEDEATNGGLSKTQVSQDSKSDEVLTKKCYQFFHANFDSKGFAKVQAQIQSLVMWFIESATMVDYEDPRWDFFTVYEKYNPKSNDITVSAEDRYFFVGYATVYRYYAYPDKIRPRIAQMLILPPYRRNGVGSAFLDAIYNHYIPDPLTLDITVEDPNEDFIALRDLIDCKNCLLLPTFQPEQLKKGWSQDMATEAQEKLKLCRRQARKIYEILKFRVTDTSDEEEYKKYRLEIKNRLNVPQQRLKLDCDKVEKRGLDLPDAMRAQRDNQKFTIAQLEENYQELVKQYQHTISKLKALRTYSD